MKLMFVLWFIEGGGMFGRYPPAATAFPSLAAFPHGPLHDPWSR